MDNGLHLRCSLVDLTHTGHRRIILTAVEIELLPESSGKWGFSLHTVIIAMRRLLKSWSFTLIVTLTVGLGVGANTAIFTLVHAVLLRSLPVQDPKQLYRVGDGANSGVMDGLQRDGQLSLFPFDLYQHLQQNTPQFSQLAAFQSGPEQMVARGAGQDAKSAITEYVSGNYFETLGVMSSMGPCLE